VHGRIRRHGWLRRRRFGSAELQLFEYTTSGGRLRGLNPEPVEVDFGDWNVDQLRDANEEHLQIELIDVDPESAPLLKNIAFAKIGDQFYKLVGAPRQPITETYGTKQDWVIVIESQGTEKVA
jgi:hypothetical protein